MGQHDVISESRSVEFIDESGVRVVWTPPSNMTNQDFYDRAATVSINALPGTVAISGADIPGQINDTRDMTLGQNFVGETSQLATTNLSTWSQRADNDTRIDPSGTRAITGALRPFAGSSAAAAAAAAAASRRSFYDTENAKIDAESRQASYQRGQETFDRQRGYSADQAALSMEQFAQRQAYNAESAALDIRGATGQASYNQSQLDRSLEGIGLGAMDYRRGESLAADPYRALEADQTGVASGQRRYAQDVRSAAAASEENKIALAQRGVAAAKAESDRALGLQVQGIQSAARNTASTNETLRSIAQSTIDYNSSTLESDNAAFETGREDEDRIGKNNMRLSGGTWTDRFNVDWTYPPPTVVSTDSDAAIEEVVWAGQLDENGTGSDNSNEPTTGYKNWSGSSGYANIGGVV